MAVQVGGRRLVAFWKLWQSKGALLERRAQDPFAFEKSEKANFTWKND